MVLNKLVCFALVYSLSNSPAYGANGLEAMMNSPGEYQTISSNLRINPNPEIQILERQLGMSYAKKVIPEESKDVDGAGNALGEPDGRYAEILPGGELTVKMGKPFSPMAFYNDGRVVVKEEAQNQEYSLAVLVPMIEAEVFDDKLIDIASIMKTVAYAWREIIPGLVPGGFDMPFAPQIPVDTLKIVNTGKEKLYLDAIIGYSLKKD
jgi:hypothetical protein